MNTLRCAKLELLHSDTEPEDIILGSAGGRIIVSTYLSAGKHEAQLTLLGIYLISDVR
jgi:hypothetical protein